MAAALAAAATVAGSALAVVNGSPDGGRHPYVGMAVWFPDGNPRDGFELCSGSLVSATVFVTAAHCFPEGAQVLVDMSENAWADMHSPGFGSALPGTAHPDPNFRMGAPGLSHFDRNDVSVVTIGYGGFPQANGRYAQLPPFGGYDDTLPLRQQVDIVGYGLPTPGSRMTATSTIVPGGGVTGGDFLKLSSNPAQGGATCSGDSGGPDLQAGTDTVLAISSYGPTATCNAVDYSQRLDTPEALGFVQSFLQP